MSSRTLAFFASQGDKKDSLMITTDRYQFAVMSYDPIDRILRTVANGDLRVSPSRYQIECDYWHSCICFCVLHPSND